MNSGIVLIDKPQGKTSFFLVKVLRKLTGIKKIGHAGTLDPLATGVMVMLVGKGATTLSNQLIGHDKIYDMTILLGVKTDSLDTDGNVTAKSDVVPTIEEIEKAIETFQGDTKQTPPMFSAKKVDGKKLYELARKGQEIKRKEVDVWMKIELLEYTYPNLKLRVHCSSGTYMRTLADDLGDMLGSHGTVSELRRIKSGPFSIEKCTPFESLKADSLNIQEIDENSKNYIFTT